MKFTLKPTDPSKIESDLLLSYCYEGEISSISGLNPEFMAEVREAIAKEDFTGKNGQSLILSGRGLISSYKFILFGLGKKTEFNLFSLYKSVAASLKKSLEYKPIKIVLALDSYWLSKYAADIVTKAVCEASALSSYRFLKYKSVEEQKGVRAIEEVFLTVPPGKMSLAEEGLNIAKITTDAVYFARDLINEPPEITTPAFLAETALELGKTSEGIIKVKILDRDEVSKLGMNAFLGVARGSNKEPKFIRLSYKPNNPSKKIVLIGKGITFDTGGLSLKSAQNMETMKLDMSGAASVLGVFRALPHLKPKVEIVGLIAACENMPGGGALKPGDILKALNGKTIEVLNTDAEGRLTLADALSFANLREKPDEIIDLATLTGACMVALGEEIAGMWGNNEKLITGIKHSAQKCAESVWEMPLFAEYKPLIKSHIADIKNTQTGRWGSAITAALFLSEFAGASPWVHLDIAGPAYAEKDTDITPTGGVGFGVRLLLDYLKS